MTTDTWDKEESQLYQHAKTELESVGLLDQDSDYDGMLGEAVLALVEVFAQQGHSGASAGMTLALFSKVAAYEALSPITDNPDEWYQHEEELWQNKRQGNAFSHDGGKHYYVLDEPMLPNGEAQLHESVKHVEEK